MNAFKLFAKGFRRLNTAKAFYYYGFIGLIITAGVVAYETIEIKEKLDEIETTGDTKEDIKIALKETAKNYIPIVVSAGFTAFYITKSMRKYECMLNTVERMYIQSEMKRQSLLGLIGGTAIGSSVNNKDSNYEEQTQIDSNEKLYFDEYSQQFFVSKDDEVLNADKELNKQFAKHGSAPLSLWYDYLGIKGIEHDDKLIWTWDAYETFGYSWIDILYNDVTDNSGKTYTVVRFSRFNPPSFYNCDTDCWDELKRENRILKA